MCIFIKKPQNNIMLSRVGCPRDHVCQMNTKLSVQHVETGHNMHETEMNKPSFQIIPSH